MTFRGTNEGRHPWYRREGRPQTPAEVAAMDACRKTYPSVRAVAIVPEPFDMDRLVAHVRLFTLPWVSVALHVINEWEGEAMALDRSRAYLSPAAYRRVQDTEGPNG